MGRKKMISAIILYIFLVVLLFQNTLLSRKVQAASTIKFETLDEKSTAIPNKYGIDGDILKVQQYSDCTIVMTSFSLYCIKNDVAKEYVIGNLSKRVNINRNGQDIILTPVEDANNFSAELIKINLDTGDMQVLDSYYKYMKDYSYYEIEEANVDSNNNKWFSALVNSNNHGYYKLFRVGNDGVLKEIKSYDQGIVRYEKLYNNISYDNHNNMYYTMFINDYNNQANNQYRLERVNADFTVTPFSFTDDIKDYKVGANGDIWAIQGNKYLIHLDNKGGKLTQIALNNGKNLSLDGSGNLYVLDNNVIKEVVNNQLVEKVKFDSTINYEKLNLLDENNYVLSSENALNIANQGASSPITVDSYVKSFPNLVKDNLGNLNVLSRNNYEDTNTNLKILKVKADGTSEYKNIPNYNENIDEAKGYNNEVYILLGNTVFKINSSGIQPYVTLNDYANYMEMDSSGAIYCISLNANKLYKINPDKSIQVYDTASLHQPGNYFDKLFKDKYGSVYMSWKDYSVFPDTYSLFKINDINNINKIDVTKLNSGNVTTVFLNQNDELDFALGASNIYKIGANGAFEKDSQFDGDSSIYNAGKIVKASDGMLFMVSEDNSSIFKKAQGEANFTNITPDLNRGSYYMWIRGIETDNQGRVYVTSYDNGLQVYDTAAPIVKSTNPTNQSMCGSLEGKITINLSEFILAEQNFRNISVSNNGVKISVNCELSGNSLVIKPSEKLSPNSTYTVTIPKDAIKDMGGNTLLNDLIFNFKTINADINGDGTVNILDLAQSGKYYNVRSTDSLWAKASIGNFNKDNIIDLYDLVAISRYIQ